MRSEERNQILILVEAVQRELDVIARQIGVNSTVGTNIKNIYHCTQDIKKVLE